MLLPDVNVLIYAFRKDMPKHAVARAWLDRAILDDAPLSVSPLTLSAVVRVTTRPGMYRTPSTLEEAFGFGRNPVPDNSPVEIVWFDAGHGQEIYVIHVEAFDVQSGVT